MTAIELLERCNKAGVSLSAGPGGALEWEADMDPPAALLDTLGKHKSELLRLLTALPPALSLLDLPPDHWAAWEERASIMHFDGQFPWEQAEVLALADVIRHADLGYTPGTLLPTAEL